MRSASKWQGLPTEAVNESTLALDTLPNQGRASTVTRPQVPWRRLALRMLPVTVVYFCYGWTLWLFLSWIAQYFLHSYDLNLTKSALFASTVFFAGVLGDTLGGIVTDKIFERTRSLKRARSWMVSICMFFTLLALIPIQRPPCGASSNAQPGTTASWSICSSTCDSPAHKGEG